MTYRTISTYVDVDVDLDDFDTDDLVEELERRGKSIGDNYSSENLDLVDVIWQKRRLGQGYETEIDQLIYNVLGKIL